MVLRFFVALEAFKVARRCYPQNFATRIVQNPVISADERRFQRKNCRFSVPDDVERWARVGFGEFRNITRH